MASSDFLGYCSFTKAIEQLGDRWSLLILRELGVFGPQGFTRLATGLPGHVSRSVLSDRLRRLETLGLVGRVERSGGTAPTPYGLTSAGEGLLPTIMSLRAWAETWIPDDPAMVEREPAVVAAWLSRRLEPSRLPERRCVIELRTGEHDAVRYWLVVERGVKPEGCVDDPLLDAGRYVYVLAGPSVLLALATGRRGWPAAVADRSVLVLGEPALAADLPGWFRPADDPVTGGAGRR
jgi:DNA-binding HxlR family transcriptional regulator